MTTIALYNDIHCPLQWLPLPSTMTTIALYNDYHCPLEWLPLPSTMTTIALYKDYHCPLEWLPLPSTMTTIALYNDFHCPLQWLPLQSTMTTIALYNDFHCPLHCLPLHSTMTTIALYIVYHCPLQWLPLPPCLYEPPMIPVRRTVDLQFTFVLWRLESIGLSNSLNAFMKYLISTLNQRLRLTISSFPTRPNPFSNSFQVVLLSRTSFARPFLHLERKSHRNVR